MVFWDVPDFMELTWSFGMSLTYKIEIVFWDVTDFLSNTNMGATFQILWTKNHIHGQNGDKGWSGGGGGGMER